MARLRKGSVVTPVDLQRFDQGVIMHRGDIGLVTRKQWGNALVLFNGVTKWIWDQRLNRLDGRTIHIKCKKCKSACKRANKCEFFELNPEW